MAIVPLPQFEADLAEYEAERDKEIYERLKPPSTIVVRFGFMKMIGEFPYSGDAKPGCGSKIVVRTFRGTEIGEMLTSTCPNAGCSKSVTRKEMLEYIENSGGRDYPFERNGRAIRVATKQDMDDQAAIEQSKHELKMEARAIAERLRLPVKIVEAEPILGSERTTFYGMSEERIDPRQLIAELEDLCRTKVDLRQVGARDEARLTADYERCGQYCCCKNFLKVLKPISMRSAKVQKATLDPLKISGRCGRLMCCLRYEDQTYEELRKRLPRRKTTVGTPEGDGLVIDTQILTQLVLVELDATRKRIAVPVEDLSKPGERVTDRADKPDQADQADQADRGKPDARAADDGIETDVGEAAPKRKRKRRRSKRPTDQSGASGERSGQGPNQRTNDQASQGSGGGASQPSGDAAPKKKRRRRRRRSGGSGSDGSGGGPDTSPGSGPSGGSDGG